MSIIYANFLITGPDGYATNAETEEQALNLLADAIDDFARRLEMRLLVANPVMIKKMRNQAKRVRATNPVTAHWPKHYRFTSTNPWLAVAFYDFAAERNQPREEA